MKKNLLLGISLGANLLFGVYLAFSFNPPSSPETDSLTSSPQRTSPAQENPLPTSPAPIASSAKTSLPIPSSARNPPARPSAAPLAATLSSPTSRAAFVPSVRETPPSIESSGSTPAPSQEDASLGPATTVNPAAPGNAFAFRGVRVSVAEAYKTAQGGTALAVDVTPEALADNDLAPNFSSSTSFAPETADSTASPAISAPSPSIEKTTTSTSENPVSAKKSSSGFSEDEELFRLKWGWEAFDAAQREALWEAGQTQAN